MESRPDQSDLRREHLLTAMNRHEGSFDVFLRFHAPEVIEHLELDEIHMLINERVPKADRAMALGALGVEALSMGETENPLEPRVEKGT